MEGVPARSLCRSHLRGHHAGQPVALVVCLNGLCVAVRSASNRFRSNALCQRHLWFHPSQVAQDWRFGAVQRPPDQSRDGVSLSSSGCLGTGRPSPRRRRKRPRLARLTRAAASRRSRGIIPKPTETASSLRRQRKMIPALLAPTGATRRHAHNTSNTALGMSAQSRVGTVRFTG